MSSILAYQHPLYTREKLSFEAEVVFRIWFSKFSSAWKIFGILSPSWIQVLFYDKILDLQIKRTEKLDAGEKESRVSYKNVRIFLYNTV
jgi:hypothetical protein